ncbi:MAG: hypothetical protein P4L83_20710 [Nevskia sp.]|nr:hypothetical protein [Nevskia sp.]
MNKPRLRSLWLLAGVATAACSTNQFKDPVKSFDTSVGTTQDLVGKYEAVTQVSAVDAAMLPLVQSPHRLVFDPGRCRIGAAAGCYVMDASTGGSVGAVAPLTAPAEAARLLKAYSRALAGVVDADTSEDLDKSADKLGDSISALAKKMNAGASFEARVDPVTKLFELLAGNYVEYKRFKILRSAVDQADGPVQGLSRDLATIVNDQQRAAVLLQASATQNLVAGLPPGRRPPPECNIGGRRPDSAPCAIADLQELSRRSGLATAVASAAALRALAGTDAHNAVLKLGEAHHALRLAVDQPGAGVDTSEKALQAFAKQAKDAYDAISKLTK